MKKGKVDVKNVEKSWKLKSGKMQKLYNFKETKIFAKFRKVVFLHDSS